MTTGRERWGVVALFAAAAVVAAIPAVGGFRSEFMADGAPGYGEAASGDQWSRRVGDHQYPRDR